MKILEFSSDVYTPECVAMTALVYKDFAKISIENCDSRIRVYFYECRFSEERTVKEFENYLIGIENTHGTY